MAIAIKVEKLSKAYQLGEIGTGTLSRDIERWLAKIRGKEDPFLKVGEVNDRTVASKSNIVWSLKDINFEIEQGDTVGIIGRNGAGKSTLLKILSRVTSPSKGIIKAKGRIASLLEVGTGFHPELTGRENIFLNGAILGMRKREIEQKFDEIVDFSGVEKYIDTPVKRYSSGMYVRLAFAVAAHLDSEILIVDEVLAVGDAEFQTKCLGKMDTLSKGEGRTILFVSHNMSSIEILCKKGILLESGSISKTGDINDIIKYYKKQSLNIPSFIQFEEGMLPGNEFAKLIQVGVLDLERKQTKNIQINQDFFIEIVYLDLEAQSRNTAIIHIKDEYGNTLFASNEFNSEKWLLKKIPGRITATCRIPGNFLSDGTYTVLVAVGHYNPNLVHVLMDDVISFSIQDTNSMDTVRKNTNGKWPGVIRPYLEWDILEM